MRAYTAESEEALRARRSLKEWEKEGLLTRDQYERLEQETASDLRTTNIYLRVVLFVFTVFCVAAAIALFFWVVLSRQTQHAGVFFLVFAAVCYAAAESIVYQERLYRHGIEEALAVCSVGLFCWGLEAAFFSSRTSPLNPHTLEFLVPAAGIVLSLWIWHRFGLWYAFPAAMIFTLFLPDHWTPSSMNQHLIVAVFYAIGLAAIAAIRPRHRPDYLSEAYSLAEAFLWLGIYLEINLKLLALNPRWMWWVGPSPAGAQFFRWCYWATWVMIWCLPPLILARGVRLKNRFLIGAGAFAALLTFVSNKPYLGWQRHTWDPMLLGIFLTGAALLLRRWLASGPDGVRHGFTTERLSQRDKRWVNIGSAALGFVSPQSLTSAPQNSTQNHQFGGGASGGAGASGDF